MNINRYINFARLLNIKAIIPADNTPPTVPIAAVKIFLFSPSPIIINAPIIIKVVVIIEFNIALSPPKIPFIITKYIKRIVYNKPSIALKPFLPPITTTLPKNKTNITII